MKIEFHESVGPEDVLNRLMSLMSYHESLIHEISQPDYVDGPEERFGHTILIDLQKALLKAAIEKQVATDASKLKAVNA